MAPLEAAQEDHATPQDLFDMVTQGIYVLENLGDEGLEAFNDPHGEFVYKDTYVYVMNCRKGTIAAHPMAGVRGLQAASITCPRTGRAFLADACERIGPEGGWIEYWWPKLDDATGQGHVYRKIGFVVSVPGKPYQVGSGIYDENMSLEQLRKLSEQWARGQL